MNMRVLSAISILAKVERDEYIDDYEKNPDLKEKYSIHTNKGYGAKNILMDKRIWYNRMA